MVYVNVNTVNTAGMSRRIGILGGTFDPPHIGHLVLAEFARNALELDGVWFVPAASPPHKPQGVRTEALHRLAMVERAIIGNAAFSVSRADIDRPGPHYTIDLMRLLRSENPHAAFTFIMGGDSLRDLPRWSRPHQLIELCDFAVMHRPGIDDVRADMHAAILPGLAARVTMIEASLLDLSSTVIVERVRAGQSVRYLIPDGVLDYLQTHHLYEATDEKT